MSAILFFQNQEVPDSFIIINLNISLLWIRIYNCCIRIICTSLWDMVGGWDAAARGYHYDRCTRPVIELLMWTGFLQLRAHCLCLGSSAVFRRMRFAVRCGSAAVRRWHPRPRKSCASAYAACGATESAWCANMWAITRTRLLGGKSKWSDNYRRESSSSACATDGPVE